MSGIPVPEWDRLAKSAKGAALYREKIVLIADGIKPAAGSTAAFHGVIGDA